MERPVPDRQRVRPGTDQDRPHHRHRPPADRAGPKPPPRKPLARRQCPRRPPRPQPARIRLRQTLRDQTRPRNRHHHRRNAQPQTIMFEYAVVRTLNHRQPITKQSDRKISMALPSKNRRLITVDDRRYYWVFDPFRLAGNDAYIAVQDADGSGRKLFLRWIGLALPRFVREAIRFAIAHGWSPEGESDLEIGCDSFADPTRFYLKPEGAGQHWFHDWWLEQNPGRIFLTPMSEYDIPHWKPKRNEENRTKP